MMDRLFWELAFGEFLGRSTNLCSFGTVCEQLGSCFAAPSPMCL